MRAAMSVAVLCAASFVGDVYLDDVTSQEPPQLRDATLPRPSVEPTTEPSLPGRRARAMESRGNGTEVVEVADRRAPGPNTSPAGAPDVSEEDEYYDDEEDDDTASGDGPNQDGASDEYYDEEEDDYGDDDYGEDDDDEDDYEEEDGERDSSIGEGDASARAGDEEVEVAEGEVEELTRQAEVRSLRDLPLSRLLQVQTELRRLAGSVRVGDGPAQTGQSEGRPRRPADTGRCKPSCSTPAPESRSDPRNPSALALNWGGSSSTRAPQRRGGWQYEEYAEEEEEEEGGWIWNKGKKKGKGDIGSVFQIAVTFLAFLAFGGYLLCLIIQAIKGGKGYGWYPYYSYTYTPVAAQSQLRPTNNVMLLTTPNRLTGTRRPTRPVTTGRRRRDVPADSWWPSWSEEDQTSSRLWPHVDVDRMHRALLLVAEGYATYYHKKYIR